MRCYLSAILLASCALVFGAQSVQETISACLNDLHDGSSPERRRAAVLVLGKYDTLEVAAALGECLGDDDVEVRRSALVALSETPSRLRSQAGAVFACLKDEDVHVRRLASSSLDVCLGGAVSGGIRISGSGSVRGVSRSGIEALLETGLRDADEEVRRNVLRSLKYGGVAVDFRAILPFLKYESPDVVCEAIQAIASGRGPQTERLEALKPLAHHENAAVRCVLCESLLYLGGGIELLMSLSADAEEEVRLSALLSRGALHDSLDATLARDVEKALESGALRAPKGEQLLSLLSSLSDESAWRFVQKALFDGANAEVQEAAWLQMLRHADWQTRLSVSEMATAMSGLSGNQRIRSMLISMLRKHGREIGDDEMETMLASNLVQSRLALLELLRYLADERQEQVLMELMMDDDADVRLQAARQISSLRPEGWEEILVATLEDPDSALQLAAAQGLARGKITKGKVADALRVWLPNCRDAAFKLRLERQLEQR